jgi:lysophospholipase L1-like esterase
LQVRGRVRSWLGYAVVIAVVLILAACTAPSPAIDAPAAERPGGTPTRPSTAALPSPIIGPSQTSIPTLTPAITSTPLPTLVIAVPGEDDTPATPLPADQRDYELCVAIASDSNGYGHVTFQVPDPAQDPPPVAITYIKPLAVPLQAHLNAVGLDYLTVIDRSLSAGGLTIDSSNYLASDQLYRLKQDRCKFVVITPFYPDVAVDLSQPEDYITNLTYLIDDLTHSSPASRLLVLNFYQTDRADFTVSNSGRGLRPERIDTFNAALEATCSDENALGGNDQVTCIDVQPFFEDMASPHVLGATDYADYQASLDRVNGYTPIIDAYFAAHPDGELVGDGIHLSLAGRDRMAERLAAIINNLNNDF